MGEVIQFTPKPEIEEEVEKEITIVGEAFCSGCGKEWEATAPGGVVELECPQCHTMKGLFKSPCIPEVWWTCRCGCYVFVLSPNGIICYNCGKYQTWGPDD